MSELKNRFVRYGITNCKYGGNSSVINSPHSWIQKKMSEEMPTEQRKPIWKLFLCKHKTKLASTWIPKNRKIFVFFKGWSNLKRMQTFCVESWDVKDGNPLLKEQKRSWWRRKISMIISTVVATVIKISSVSLKVEAKTNEETCWICSDGVNIMLLPLSCRCL